MNKSQINGHRFGAMITVKHPAEAITNIPHRIVSQQLRVICNRMVNKGGAFPLLVVCWPMCVEDNRTGVFTWFHFDWWPFIMCVVCVWRFGLGGKRRPYNEVVHSTANFGPPRTSSKSRILFTPLKLLYRIEINLQASVRVDHKRCERCERACMRWGEGEKKYRKLNH